MNISRDAALSNANLALSNGDASEQTKDLAREVISTIESLDIMNAPESDYESPLMISMSL